MSDELTLVPEVRRVGEFSIVTITRVGPGTLDVVSRLRSREACDKLIIELARAADEAWPETVAKKKEQGK